MSVGRRQQAAGSQTHSTGSQIDGENSSESEQCFQGAFDSSPIAMALCTLARSLLNASDWSSAIDEVLRELGQAAHVSRAHLLVFDEAGTGVVGRQVAEWAAPGIVPQIDNQQLQNQRMSEFPGIWDSLSRGEIVHRHRRDVDEATAALLKEQDIESLLAVPLMSDDSCLGCLGFDDCGSERDWSTAEIEALRTAAEVLTAAISRGQADEALRKSEQHFRAVFDNAKDAIAILDDERRYVEANQSYLDLFRTTREQLVGGRSDDALSPEAIFEIEHRWHRLLNEGEISEDVAYELATGDRIQAELLARANFLPGRHLLVMRNVTEQRALESQLLQAQRLEAIGLLAGGIAHDFNNLLTAISGYGEFLLEGLADGDPLRRDAEEIRRAADVATALVRQLLAFSRRQMLQPRTVDLNAIVRQMESLLAQLIGEDIRLSVELAPTLPPVRADPGQLEQIIVNLAVNARDSMSRGGAVSIRTEPGDKGRRVRLVVSDTGRGMDEYTRLHAFDPFFTTKEPGKGTGLGLATVYGIVTQSNGTIEIESQPGRGATFRLDFPAIRSLQDLDQPDPAARSTPGKETVLLVEDEDIVRSLTERVLISGGYRVLSASHGEEALELVATAGGEIDVVLTDVVMPGMSGKELAERLTATRPTLRVLFTSGYSTEPICESNGYRTAFIAKPFTPEGLRQAVRALLEEH
jgi:two-component system, cell cycle sensor histidine kinase and response regulator CckA